MTSRSKPTPPQAKVLRAIGAGLVRAWPMPAGYPGAFRTTPDAGMRQDTIRRVVAFGWARVLPFDRSRDALTNRMELTDAGRRALEGASDA